MEQPQPPPPAAVAAAAAAGEGTGAGHSTPSSSSNRYVVRHGHHTVVDVRAARELPPEPGAEETQDDAGSALSLPNLAADLEGPVAGAARLAKFGATLARPQYILALSQQLEAMFLAAKAQPCGPARGRSPAIGPLSWVSPVVFADAATEAAFREWSTTQQRQLRRGVTTMLIGGLSLIVGFGIPARAAVISGQLLGFVAATLVSWFTALAIMWRPILLPACLRSHVLDVISGFLTLGCCIASVLLNICSDTVQTHYCAALQSGCASGSVFILFLVLHIIFGVGLSVQVPSLLVQCLCAFFSWALVLVRYPLLASDITTLVLGAIIMIALLTHHNATAQVACRVEFLGLLQLAESQYQYRQATYKSQEQLEEARRKVVRATTAKSIQDSITAYTCHELRSPLHALRGCVEDMRSKVASGHSTAAAAATQQGSEIDDLNRMDESIAHMSQIADDVLDFARLQAGRLQVRVRATDVRDVVQRLARTYQRLHPGRLEVNIHPDVPDVVHSDPLRITQILTNGITNAFKHALEGTSVKIVCSLDATPVRTTPCVLLEVFNNGHGLGMTDSRALFEPFERGMDANTEIQGVGLGLPICKMLTQLLGGQIGLEDRGLKTVFWALLPVNSQQVVTEPQPLSVMFVSGGASVMPPPLPGSRDSTTSSASNFTSVSRILMEAGVSQQFTVSSDHPWLYWGRPIASLSGKLRCVVVDDEALARSLLGSMIRRAGHEVDLIEGNTQLMAELDRGQQYDIFFLDIHLRGTNGADLAKSLVRRGIPCALIATSGSTSMDDIRAYHRGGFDGVLGKPFRAMDVRNLLLDVLHS